MTRVIKLLYWELINKTTVLGINKGEFIGGSSYNRVTAHVFYMCLYILSSESLLLCHLFF